jgi:DHA3 family macrolide efflux protein-like MFS transporter
MAVLGPLADVISVEVLLVSSGVLMIGAITLAVLIPSGRAAVAAVLAVEEQRAAEAAAKTVSGEASDGDASHDAQPASS